MTLAGTRDGNGYPIPETRRVFTLLGYGYGLISITVGFLMGDNLYPAGTRHGYGIVAPEPANPRVF
jgi:hypothetical protein